MKRKRVKSLKDNVLAFELWLYVVKHFGQTFDAAKLIYEQLSDSEKENLKKEYETYVKAASD